MRRALRLFFNIILIAVLAGAIAAAFWLGIVPQRYSPFPPITLDEAPGIFLDAQLATLRREPEICRAALKAPYILATQVADNPFKNGCGWRNSVRVQGAAGIDLSVEPLTCEMAAALALWINYSMQPAAEEILGSRVKRIRDMGTYDCRNIIGNKLWRSMRSEHAKANAIDIAGFVLEDGREISVAKDWKGEGPQAKFLKEVHRRSCRFFRVALSPDFNAAHHDHFHFDRGLLWRCK
jgi:hypothetical protein